MAAQGGHHGGKLITGKAIKNNAITGKKIKNGSLTAKDLKKGVVKAGVSGAPGQTRAAGGSPQFIDGPGGAP